ncbi:MAG: ATP-binding cassette domain-containing protein [Candidatus Bathyarchaeia archaeon]
MPKTLSISQEDPAVSIEHFEIKRVIRKFDIISRKFIINISYETAPPKLTERVIGVADAFGLGIDESKRFVIYDDIELKIGPKDIVYVTGDSGSGKSVLLKALEKDIRETGFTCINISEVKPEESKPIIETVGRTLDEALELLSFVGLNDAFLFLRNYEQLSDGQKYRYKIAKMIESEAQFWLLDEFASTLDRDTAKIVAFNLQKLARKLGRAVIAATTHTDLFEDLAPSVHIHKRFGREVTIKYYPNQSAEECSLTEEMHVEEGSMEDWRALAEYHYRSHKVVAPRKIFRLMRSDELCGVIVYAYPPPVCFGRKLVLPKMTQKELNEKLSTISRVVIHPKYRSIGLGTRLVRETLPLAGTPYVEMLAVMARYNPFAEKAGMLRVAERKPPKQAAEIMEALRRTGFNIHLLTSEKYVINRLKMLNKDEIEMIKEEFKRNIHPRFVRALKPEKTFGSKRDYIGGIESIDVEKLAHLIKICGILAQTKVYLFWQREKPKRSAKLPIKPLILL